MSTKLKTGQVWISRNHRKGHNHYLVVLGDGRSTVRVTVLLTNSMTVIQPLRSFVQKKFKFVGHVSMFYDKQVIRRIEQYVADVEFVNDLRQYKTPGTSVRQKETLATIHQFKGGMYA